MRKKSTIKIGKILQSIRKSNGYTQEQLAEKIDVSVRFVSDVEQDKSKPSYEVLVRICNLYGIGMDTLFSEHLDITENKKPEYTLAGFDKLSQKDKNTIENLIIYFNKR